MVTTNGVPSVVVVNVDNQNDFDRPGASLYVPGAEHSAERSAKLIDSNHDPIKMIFSSYDKHGKKHIFYAMWWVDTQGNHPKDFTKISYSDVTSKKWIPLYDVKWSNDYVKTLGSIDIWPIHCSKGKAGSEMFPVLAKAIARHSAIKPLDIEKGQSERTEFYGIFGAEKIDPIDPRTKLNISLMKLISGFDLSLWLGQEAGHCLKRSLEQYIDWCTIYALDAISKMRYVSDCTNRLPLGPEYDRMIDDSISNMVKKGMKVITSTDPLF